MEVDQKKGQKISYILKLLGRKRSSNFSGDNYTLSEDWEDEKMTELTSAKSEIHKVNTLHNMLRSKPIYEDPYISESRKFQNTTENEIRSVYQNIIDSNNFSNFNTFRSNDHIQYIVRSLEVPLPYYFKALDASSGWLIYWLLNSYSLISNDELKADIKNLVSEKINEFIVDDGLRGIGGGKDQIGHVASVYSSILALVLVEDLETLSRIRANLYTWFLSLKQKNGSFIMHENGESDTRSTYCVIVISSLLNILTEELAVDTLEWLNNCQTYEGGFSGVPNAESHGGYTFCALASYFLLLGKYENLDEELSKNIDIDNLIRWAAMRQHQSEGGLSGRSNKLVDACYSFWVGALFPLLESIKGSGHLFDREALQTYILNCAQNASSGGFRDKPGKSVDFYHTNYTICGLSICEHSYKFGSKQTGKMDEYAYIFECRTREDGESNTKPINPIFSLPLGLAEKTHDYFVRLDN